MKRFLYGIVQRTCGRDTSIGSFEFADGSSLSTTELLARGFDLGGTAGGSSALLRHIKPEAANDSMLLAA